MTGFIIFLIIIIVLYLGAKEKSKKKGSNLYGDKEKSGNKEFQIIFCDGHYSNDKWKSGTISLLNKQKKILFSKNISRPNDCHVSNNGTVICCDWQNSDELTGIILIFNSTGTKLFSLKTSANLGASAISIDSKIAIFETLNSKTEDADKLFIIDIQNKSLLNKIPSPTSFKNAHILTDKRIIRLKNHNGFLFEIDFEGNQTNKIDYESQIMSKGSIYDQLWFYDEKTESDKYKDEKYLKILNKGLNDNDTLHLFGKDKIYRKIGEYYEANNNTEQTIIHWKKALEINPKIGVKRKFESLIKNSTTTNKTYT